MEEVQLLKQQLLDKDKTIAESDKGKRLLEFKHKKQVAELNLNLEAESLKVKNHEEQLRRLNAQLTELEIKLTESEGKIIVLADENAQLKKARKSSTSSDEESVNVKFMPRQSMIQKVGNISDLPSYQDLVGMLQSYEGNNQQLQDEMQKYQNGTMDALNNRDNQITLLEEEISNLQKEHKEQVNELQKQLNAVEDKLTSQNAVIVQQKQALEQLKQDKDAQQSDFMQKLKEVTEQSDAQRLQIDDAVGQTESNYKRTMMIQEEQYQHKEQELVEQLQQSEEKLQQYDQQLIQQGKAHKLELKEKVDEMNILINNKTTQIQQLQQQIIEISTKHKSELSKAVNDVKNDMNTKITALTTKQQELTQQIDQDSKKIKKLEIEKKRRDEQIAEQLDNIKSLEAQQQQLKDKLNSVIEQYEQKLRQQLVVNDQIENQHSQESEHNRASISSVDPRNFEVEFLKAQLEQLKQKGDVELQSEISKLNERERQLKKEIVDLQNDLGTSRLNLTLCSRKLEQQVEGLQQDVEHAQSEQQYAEQIAATISVQHANLAMEYESIEGITQIKELMIYLLIFAASCIDITQLYSIPSNDKTMLFQSELQVDQKTNKKPINPIPDNIQSDEVRMKQILYEQEERRHETKLAISDKQPKKPGQDDEESEEEEYIPPQTSATVPRKQLQRHMIPGKEVKTIEEIEPIAIQHKLIITVFIIVLISVLILMRESYGSRLHKLFRKALWRMALSSLTLSCIILLGVALYYNNYFDTWLLTSQTEKETPRGTILMIEVLDYNEIYSIDIYGYLLIIGICNCILMFINYLHSYTLNTIMMDYYDIEQNWPRRTEYVNLLIAAQEELKSKQARFEQILQLGGGENTDIKYQMKQIPTLIKKLEEHLQFYMKKSQFLQRIQPYMGPSCIRDDFPFSIYLLGNAAELVSEIHEWKPITMLCILISLILISILSYVFNIIAASIIVSLLCFYYIVDTNYRVSLVYDASIINAPFAVLLEEEMRQFPKFLAPIFDEQPPKQAIDPQTALFPFQSKQFIIYSLSYLQKISTLIVMITLIYLIYWNKYSIKVNIFMIVVVLIMWISVQYISLRVIEQLSICTSMYIKNYDLIYQIVQIEKIALMKASQQFYEFTKHLHRTMLQHELQREYLVLFRPEIVDILASCNKYAKEQYQVQYDSNEQQLIDLGLRPIRMVHKKYLHRIVKQLNCKLSAIEYTYLLNYCELDANYFSPTKLIVYSQMRVEEVQLNPIDIMESVLQSMVAQIYPKVLKLDEAIEDPDYMKSQMNGVINLQSLDDLLSTACQSKQFDEVNRQIVINNLYYLHPLSPQRVSQFIANQILQMPR